MIAMPSPHSDKPRVAMIQDGRRRRYLIPLALQGAGILERVYADWFVSPGSKEEKLAGLIRMLRPGLGQTLAERSCPELNPALVKTNAALAIWMRMRTPRFQVSEDSYIWAARRTAKWIAREGFGNANALYGFIRNAAPEIFAAAKSQGLGTCGDQFIAPLEVEVAEMKEQSRRWPGWSKSEIVELHPPYLEMEQKTWEQLDQITCMSDYVREGLISVGVSPGKITILPYPWTESSPVNFDRAKRQGPLTVGFMGAVGLRKGAPYFLEVARRFDPGQVRFVMIGNLLIDPSKLEKYSGHVEISGAIPRSQVSEWMRKIDIFFLPTTCEGSAGSVMEAMAAGLPVLTTLNAGSRVRNGIEGFISRYDDLDRFEQNIRQLEADRDLMLHMGAAARQRVLLYDLQTYQADLASFFAKLINRDS
jgi:hypothetical protein